MVLSLRVSRSGCSITAVQIAQDDVSFSSQILVSVGQSELLSDVSQPTDTMVSNFVVTHKVVHDGGASCGDGPSGQVQGSSPIKPINSFPNLEF